MVKRSTNCKKIKDIAKTCRYGVKKVTRKSVCKSKTGVHNKSKSGVKKEKVMDVIKILTKKFEDFSSDVHSIKKKLKHITTDEKAEITSLVTPPNEEDVEDSDDSDDSDDLRFRSKKVKECVRGKKKSGGCKKKSGRKSGGQKKCAYGKKKSGACKKKPGVKRSRKSSKSSKSSKPRKVKRTKKSRM